jgi:hypothetical protein
LRILVGILGIFVLSAPEVAVADTSVRGIVLRAPAPVPRAVTVNRYRDRAPAPADDAESAAGCACNPGLFAVVHLTGENMPPIRLPMTPPLMAQKDRMFVPSVVAVPVGGTVEFPNWDPYFHNVFSYSKTRKFDLGRYPQGETESVQFEEAGIVPIFCEIHYAMRAYVHVLESPYYTVSDELRQFEISGVEPGDYVLHVWQENLPEITKAITVGVEPLYVELP